MLLLAPIYLWKVRLIFTAEELGSGVFAEHSLNKGGARGKYGGGGSSS